MPKNKLHIICFILISVISHIHAEFNVICVGNSITLGFGLNTYTQPYPYQLGVLLGSDYSTHNLGHAGCTILKNGDVPYWEYPEYEHAVGQTRDIAVILFGTNATRSINWDYHSNEFENDYLEFISKIKLRDDVHHLVLGLPPPIISDSVRNDILINEVVPKIKNIANQSGATIADLYHQMINHPEWFQSDEIHPNAVGDSVIAQIVFTAIQKAITPNIPTGLKTISGFYNVTLKWNASAETDLSYYSVYKSDNPGIYPSYFSKVLYPQTTYIDNDVIHNQIYTYQIRAIDINGTKSPKTGRVIGKTLDDIPPNAPTNLLVIHKPDTILVTWNPNAESDVAYYNIYRNTNETDFSEGSILIGSVDRTQNTYNDILFEDATTYYYGITATDLSNNTSNLSNPFGITTTSHPICADTIITLAENTTHSFSSSDFPYSDLDNHQLDKVIFINSNHFEFFSYNGNNIDSTIICDDISKLLFTPNLYEFGENYAEFSFRVVDSFGSTSKDTNTIIINVNDRPSDFNIIAPISDSTLVINKSTYLNTFLIRWEEASDSLNDGILYDIIFTGDLSALSQYSLNTTNTEYILKDILSVTDTVSISHGTFSIFASDGYLQTDALNSGYYLTIDGRSLAPAKLHLDQNYPNPFNNSTLIGFDLPRHANVSIIIYDLLGEEIIKLIDNKKYERGYSTIIWNSLDKHNNIVTAGIYLMQIRMGDEFQHKKLIFLK